MKHKIALIGSQMDLGAFRKGVDMGPLAIRHTELLPKLRRLGYDIVDYGDIVPLIANNEGNPKLRNEREINNANFRLYSQIGSIFQDDRMPIVLGGDHSIAIGSISASLTHYEKIGIIWVDAHTDFNDEQITPSGNIHGMPLSVVCGYGPESLITYCSNRALISNVVIIGARSIDPLEKLKLKDKKVTVYSISDVHNEGIHKIIQKAIEIASNGTNGIHLSFDMDAIDPIYAPGVGTPVVNGLTQREAFILCEEIHKSKKLIAMDVVETNPLLDNQNMTGILASELILTCLGTSMYK